MCISDLQSWEFENFLKQLFFSRYDWFHLSMQGLMWMVETSRTPRDEMNALIYTTACERVSSFGIISTSQHKNEWKERLKIIFQHFSVVVIAHCKLSSISSKSLKSCEVLGGRKTTNNIRGEPIWIKNVTIMRFNWRWSSFNEEHCTHF